MKKKSRGNRNRSLRVAAALPGPCLMGAALLLGAGAARSEDAVNPSFEGGTNTFGNWLTLSAGGMFTQGSKPQAEQSRHLTESAFGGVEDFHYGTEVAKKTTFSADGRGIYDHDYNLTFGLKKEDTYYLRLNAQNYRTWYNGAGGYYPPGNLWYPLGKGALGLDRGEITLEGGMTLKGWPALDFKYSHLTRDGEKSSTIWGQTHPDFINTRGLAPSFYGIDETRDIFELNGKKRIKTTDVGLSLRYETGTLNNGLYLNQYPGEPTDRKVSDRQGVNYDVINVHAFTETWLNKKLFLSTGYLFVNMDSDFSGSRIYGTDFDVSYAPNALNGAGYSNLAGGAGSQEHVGTINLMYLPNKNLSITPSIRIQEEDWDGHSGTFATLGNSFPAFQANKDEGDALDVRERIDVKYSGVTNSVLYAQAEWTEGQGNLGESGGIYLGGPIQRKSEDGRFFQKYSAGCRVYPLRWMNFDVGGYFKKNAYDYDHQFDSTPNAAGGNRYPAFLVMQDFDTYDGYTRLTFRPLPNLTLVSRYEYQFSTINTKPDPTSGFSETQSSEMVSHILAQNVSWSPWARLYLQAGFNYVLSETRTPTSDYTQAILNAQNNYWSVNFNSGLVLDNKTDLNLGYTYYHADDYTDNSASGLPLGAGAEEHGVTATVLRRINDHLRLTLRYGYYHSEDPLYGGNSNYDAHVVFSSLQYRF